jgi:hypothetical protein
VRGKYISLTPGKEIKQTWALQSPTWPEGNTVNSWCTVSRSMVCQRVWKMKLVGILKGTSTFISFSVENLY